MWPFRRKRKLHIGTVKHVQWRMLNPNQRTFMGQAPQGSVIRAYTIALGERKLVEVLHGPIYQLRPYETLDDFSLSGGLDLNRAPIRVPFIDSPLPKIGQNINFFPYNLLQRLVRSSAGELC